MNKINYGGTIRNDKRVRTRGAFTLVEVVASIAVFSILLLAVIGLSRQVQHLATLSTRKTTAATIAQEQMETVRNLPFDQIGSDITYPTGPLKSSQTIIRNGGNFTVTLAINYIDDPSDGVAPADTVPADYKQVEVRVCWDTGSCNQPIRLTTIVVPKTLEYANNAGALFVTVIDSNGQPVGGATVHVTNASPAVDVVNQTDVNGKLQLLNLPAASNSYRVVVTKNGYSSDQTVAADGANPNPVSPDASVVTGQVNSVTLAIDRVSTLVVRALDQTSCDGLGSVNVRIRGERLIGTTPDVLAYDKSFTTDAAGQFIVANLPWDNYSLTVSSSSDVAGITPPDNIRINPGSTVSGSVVLAPHTSSSSRIIVRDIGTHGPIANATVSLNNGGAYSSTLVTDQGIIQQNTWVGGPGQADFVDVTKYASLSGAVDTGANNAISLATETANASVTEDFNTTNAQDNTNTTAEWNTTSHLIRLPADQLAPSQFAASAQAQSTKLNPAVGNVTVVTLNATDQSNGQTITYAVSADGSNFETVTPGIAHTMNTQGSDLRWRVTFETTDPAVSPTVSSISLSYTQLLRPVVDGTLKSSTFDNGGPTNYTTLSWEPTSQPASAGPDAVRFQVAAASSATQSGGPTIDVSADPSTTPLFTKNIGDAVNTVYIAQSFVAGTTDTIDSIDLKIAQHGTPTTVVTAYIYSNSGSAPGSNLSGSGQDINVIVSDSSSTWQNSWSTQAFAPHTALVAGTTYWLVLAVDGSNSSKYWTIVRSNIDTTYASGTAKVGAATNSLNNLCASGCDLAFRLRRSGVSETPTTPTDFIGPDGTTNTYYTTSGSSLHSSLSGLRYLRYRVLLHTDDPLVTPTINRISIIKNNACTPPGQVFFSGLPGDGTYSASVTVPGYEPSNIPLSVNGTSSQYIDMTPSP